MNPDTLTQLLADVAAGRTPVADAVARLRSLPFEQTPGATLDHHRALRCGHGEVVFCPGKSLEQVVSIAERLSAGGEPVLATRASAEQIQALTARFPAMTRVGRTLLLNAPPVLDPVPNQPAVAVVCAGSADSPVADEAMLTLRCLSVPTYRFDDIGVAGLHRLLARVEVLQKCCALVVIAGMEGALPSVVGGLVACPVFAVPSSVGYGTNFSGLTTLLAMLTTCAANVAVVNIDNGFGAALSAGLVYGQVKVAAASRR